jgi:hypothetical protein
MQRWTPRLAKAAHAPTFSTILSIFLAVFVLLGLAACATGPARRVSEPTASIQQLRVEADGRWTVDLRLQNFSNVTMRFEQVKLTLRAGEETAGELTADTALTVGPESADIAQVTLTPSAGARILVAGVLADRRNLDYTLEGTLMAAAEDRKSREYRIRRSSALSPVPGLPGVLR